MKKVFLIFLMLFFSVLFWFSIDATGVQHEAFDFLDRRTICGFLAWMCAWMARGVYEALSE